MNLARRTIFGWIASVCFAISGAAHGQNTQTSDEAEPFSVDTFMEGVFVQSVRGANADALRLFEQGDIELASEKFCDSLDFARRNLGKKHRETLGTLMNCASTLNVLKRLDEAIVLYRESLASSREVFGVMNPDTLFVQTSMADALLENGEFDEAEELFSQLVDLRKTVSGEFAPETFAVQERLGTTLGSQGQFDEALAIFRPAYDLGRQALGERDPITLSLAHGLAGSLSWLGQYDEAEQLNVSTLRLRREVLGEADPDTIATLANHASIMEERGRLLEAEALHREALALRRQSLGNTHPHTLLSLNAYALILAKLNRKAEAANLYYETLQLRTETLGRRHPDTLTSLSNYGTALYNLGRVEQAEGFFADAARLRREVLGADHPFTLYSLNNHASALADLGRYDEATVILENVIEVSERVRGPTHNATITLYANLADILYHTGDLERASEIYGKYYPIREEILGADHPASLLLLENFVAVLVGKGDERTALPLARQLANTHRERRVALSESGLRGNAQRDREIGDQNQIERLISDALWISQAKQSPTQADLASEAFISLQLASASSTSQAVRKAAGDRFAQSFGVKEVVEERDQLERNWTRLEAELVSAQSSGDEGDDRRREVLARSLAGIESRIAAIDTRLMTLAPAYYAIIRQEAIDYEDFAQTLGDDEAVLFLVPTTNGTHTLAISKEEIVWRHSPLDEDEIENVVSDFRSGLEISAGTSTLPLFDLRTAHDLYSTLIEPAESPLKGKSRVYVIADGALSRLPLGTLVTSPPSGDAFTDDPDTLRRAPWLADRYALVQLPSLQSLVFVRSFGIESEASAEDTFIGFGAPVLEGSVQLRGAQSATLDAIDAAGLLSEIRGLDGPPLMNPDALRRLTALPGTAVELEQVREALGASRDTIYLADGMTERSIRNLDLSGTSILHLATHGFTSEESGDLAEPGLVFTPPREASPTDDGYLAASEVVGLDLTLARWVILSACNTASPSGKAGETGLSGLAQAFFYAGAQSLLVSHWPVFDDIAPLLTVETLKRSQAGESRAEALQAAMRAVRNDPELDAAHPAVWGPFSLVGEGR